MWHDIMLANKRAIIGVLDDFKISLEHLENAIKADDSDAILKTFERAKAARDDFAELSNARPAPKED